MTSKEKAKRELRLEYARLRTLGWTAVNAWRAARINVAFHFAETLGLVALKEVPDPEGYDSSYVDTWTDLSASERERWKEKIQREVETWGCVGLVASAKHACGHFHEVEAVWGFLGNDTSDNGYDTDLKLAAIGAIASTYACVGDSAEDTVYLLLAYIAQGRQPKAA